MNRDNAFIRSKLLDAFIPQLCFKQDTLPLQSKSNSKTLQRPQSSISRQSYINVEQNLDEDSLEIPKNNDNFFNTEFSQAIKKDAQASMIGSQRKSHRKYLKVVSNSHGDRVSPRQSTKSSNLRRSIIFEEKKNPRSWLSMEPSHSQLKKNHSHNLSCRTLQFANNQRNNQFPVNFCNNYSHNSSVQLQASRINTLQHLIIHDESKKPFQSFAKTSFHNANEATLPIPIRQNTHIINSFNGNTIVYPKRGQPNVMCVSLGKVEPVFRTIVRKDISESKVRRMQSQKEMRQMNGRTPHGTIIGRESSGRNKMDLNAQISKKITGKQNQFLKVDTSNIRHQIVRQVLR